METSRATAADSARKLEVQKKCLAVFVEQGLAETSTRDLCRAIGVSASGLYYYYSSKDEAVLDCAETAAVTIEREIFVNALKDLDNPDKLIVNLKRRAERMKGIHRFFISVCSLEKYEKVLRPIVQKQEQMRKHYAAQFAERVYTTAEAVMPYLCLIASAAEIYMLWGNENQFDYEMRILREQLEKYNEMRDA